MHISADKGVERLVEIHPQPPTAIGRGLTFSTFLLSVNIAQLW